MFSLRSTLFALCALTSLPAFAQKDVLFGSGKPPVYEESEVDRRFLRSRVYRALNEGTADPNCAHLLRGLLTALAEAGPSFHKRDENFTVDPLLLEAVNTQLSTPRFPAANFLAAMVRRVLLDRKLPDGWMATAEAINPALPTIDMGKLRRLQEGVEPIDSLYFNLPTLLARYDEEVVKANSLAKQTALRDFRDTYLLRSIAWGPLHLKDVQPARRRAGGEVAATAVLEWTAPKPPTQGDPMLELIEKKPKGPKLRITAVLAPKQYVDLSKLPKGQRMKVVGQFWEMSRGVSQLEVREALLFEDRDWSKGALLAPAGAAQQCPFAVNDLTSQPASQPGGFRH